uniref:Ribosomal protein L10 n=1 Tax=Cafileria marina TaxID=2557541 RepID=A0A5B9IKW3_9STRA|nr:hypothetical protein [Cafileria marina]QEF30268.1 hypothetical protein [Cafileria marina]
MENNKINLNINTLNRYKMERQSNLLNSILTNFHISLFFNFNFFNQSKKLEFIKLLKKNNFSFFLLNKKTSKHVSKQNKSLLFKNLLDNNLMIVYNKDNSLKYDILNELFLYKNIDLFFCIFYKKFYRKSTLINSLKKKHIINNTMYIQIKTSIISIISTLFLKISK